MSRREIRYELTVPSDWQLEDRDDIGLSVSSLGDVVVRAGDVLAELRDDINGLTLLSGDHGKINPLKSDTSIVGSPGAHASGTSSFSERSLVANVEFRDNVELAASAEVQFVSSVFRKPIVMDAGSKAHFVACRFLDEAFVDNSASGVLANAGIIGCIKKSAAAHAAVTVIFETT